MEKACSKCGTVKPLDEFYKTKTRKAGVYSHCKACHSAMNKSSYRSNKGVVNARSRAHYQENKDAVRVQRRGQRRMRYRLDRGYAMVCRLRVRLCNSLNGQAKSASTMDLVGCSREELMAHLESKFTDGMTWDNRDEWHIDHIRPIASFEDPADPACWHWSNLQPLWAKDNLSKGART